MSWKGFFLVIFHLLGAAQFLIPACYNTADKWPEELQKFNFGGKFIYLTAFNLVIQGAFYVVALMNDFIGSNKPNLTSPPMIRRIRDYFFTAFALPMALSVSFMFWTLQTLDRQLIAPKPVDTILPLWFNQIIHTSVTVWILIELFITHHRHQNMQLELLGVSAITMSYLVWLLVIKYLTCAWVYPILEKLSTVQLVIFFILVEMIPITFYFIGKALNRLVWRQGPTEASSYDL